MEPITSGRILEIRGLHRSQGRTAVLKGVDLELSAGQRLGVLGANGSGKTTLVCTIVGLLRPHDGTLHIAGQPPGSRPAGLALGYLPERPSLADDTVSRLMATACAISGVDDRRSASILEELGIDALASDRARRLSQGQQRVVSLALALVHAPALLVLDEPFTALDGETSDRVRDALARRPDTAVLATAHREADLRGVTSACVVLRDGVVAAS